MTAPFETIMYKGFHIDIYPDFDPIDPRDDIDDPHPDEIRAYENGEVYGFNVRETGDSVWGFYGLDLSEDGPICWYAYDSIERHITARSAALAQLDSFDAAELLAN
jgi:hypothetical protein